MKAVKSCVRILKNIEMAEKIFLLELKAPKIAARARAGQFVHLKVGGGTADRDPLLRRPFSFNRIDSEAGKISIKYRVVGRGTEALSDNEPGDILDVMGPLGEGFDLSSAGDSPLIIGGGMGIAPLGPAVIDLEKKSDLTVFFGAVCASELMEISLLKKTGVNFQLATDDGSAGIRGAVTELLESRLEKEKKTYTSFDYVYGCGPEPMLKELQLLSKKYGFTGEISLESRMACGVGACLSCARKIEQGKTGGENSGSEEESGGSWNYKNVCQEGPVFSIGEVIFDD